MAVRSFNLIELCAGGGMLGVGVSAGLEHLGFAPRCVLYCEREGHAAAALVARMEEKALDCAPVWDDITTLDCRPWRGRVDCVIAGFPCPPVSLAGKREGAADERWLWPEVFKVAVESGAEFLFIENVQGLLSAEGQEVGDGSGESIHKLFGNILRDLAEGGWRWEWLLLRASDVGAAHERARVFLLAHNQRGGFEQRTDSAESKSGGRCGARIAESVIGKLAQRPSRGQRKLRESSAGDGQPDGRDNDVAGSVGNSIEPRPQGPVQRRGADTLGREGERRVIAGSGGALARPMAITASDTGGSRMQQQERGSDRGGIAGGTGEIVPTGDVADGERAKPRPGSEIIEDGAGIGRGGLADQSDDVSATGELDGPQREQRTGERLSVQQLGPPQAGGSIAGTSQVLPLFAPARNDYLAWLRILGADPTLVPALPRRKRGRAAGDTETVESEVRGMADGMADVVDIGNERPDMLRLAGNGVVPLCAAVAFVVLYRRLFEE